MRGLFNYIVSPKKERYDNKETIGNTEFVLNTDISEFKHISRTAIVKALPSEIDTPIQIGDEIIIHHNIFRRWYDIKGRERNGSSYIDEDSYLCQPDQLFMYRRNGGEWTGVDNSCFISPVENDEKYSTEKEKERVGIIEISNDYLSSLGLSVGDTVGFTPSSEYEFMIDGKKMYKMSSRDICLHYD